MVDVARYTPMFWASNGSYVGVIRLLLGYGTDPTVSDGNGWTPLFYATDGGYTEIVELLLKHGVDADTVTMFSGTALHAAFHNRRSSSFQVLVAGGASALIPTA
jgi:ankyrin repeat protein